MLFFRDILFLCGFTKGKQKKPDFSGRESFLWKLAVACLF